MRGIKVLFASVVSPKEEEPQGIILRFMYRDERCSYCGCRMVANEYPDGLHVFCMNRRCLESSGPQIIISPVPFCEYCGSRLPDKVAECTRCKAPDPIILLYPNPDGTYDEPNG